MNRFMNLIIQADLGGTPNQIAEFCSVWQVGAAIMHGRDPNRIPRHPIDIIGIRSGHDVSPKTADLTPMLPKQPRGLSR